MCWYDSIVSRHIIGDVISTSVAINGYNPDIDECVKSNGGCQHVCKNGIGSYQCLCNGGHVLGADGHSCEGITISLHKTQIICYCVDFNECSDSNGGCQQNCTNVIGSYYCSCYDGYSLDGNYHSCSCKINAPYYTYTNQIENFVM